MPYTDTSTKQLIINVLTEDQYDDIETHNPSELYLITDDDSDISAGTGISIDESSEGVNIINHSNSTTVKSTQAIYPITIDAQGHISGSGTGIELGSDTTKYLRNDGTWEVPPGGAGSVTSIGISNTSDGGLTVSGSPVTSSGIISVGHTNILTNAQTTQAIYPIAIDKNGHVSSYGTGIEIGSNTTTFLRNDGTWQQAGSITTIRVWE